MRLLIRAVIVTAIAGLTQLAVPSGASAFTPLTGTASAACVGGTAKVTVNLTNAGPMEATADITVGTAAKQTTIVPANGTESVTIDVTQPGPISVKVLDGTRGEVVLDTSLKNPCTGAKPSGAPNTGGGGALGGSNWTPVAGTGLFALAALSGFVLMRRRRVELS